MNRVPESIERFLAGNIQSFDQLEILRILGDNPAREWRIAELAREIQTRASEVASHLALLASRGLVVSVTRGTETYWRHGGENPDLEGKIVGLLQAYRQYPVQLIRLVYTLTTGL